MASSGSSRNAAGPVEVDRVQRRQADPQRAVHRRAGAGQDAADGEGLDRRVVGLDGAVAVAQHHALAEPVAALPGRALTAAGAAPALRTAYHRAHHDGAPTRRAAGSEALA